MTSALHLHFSCNRVLHRLRELLQPFVDVGAEVDGDRAALATGERLEIADRLRPREDAERELLAGEFDVIPSAARQLQEHAVRGPAFVKLTGRVKKSWTVAGRGGDVERTSDCVANLGNEFVAAWRLREVFGQRDIIAGFHLA